jgi:hypothetical protein
MNEGPFIIRNCSNPPEYQICLIFGAVSIVKSFFGKAPVGMWFDDNYRESRLNVEEKTPDLTFNPVKVLYLLVDPLIGGYK